ncbi:MAG: energy-coupling factor ABC transporter permease [Acidobacteria bacterium]|nr:energy-coupling factor ABC transporter permease [Acidobacteriota bacterium]
MHIPDGFLSTPVWAAMNLAAAPSVAYLARRAQREIEESRIPALGVMGAFVFAAQMINFPVGLGTSGHLLGSALLAVTLGPAAASIVMTAILVVQALVFQDGGVLALGANVFNMAVAGVAAAYLPYRLWSSGKLRNPAIFLGAFLSVLAGAVLAVAELLLSGVRMGQTVLGVSFGLFLVTAVLEGVITVAGIRSLEAMRPNWVRAPDSSGRLVLGALAGAAILLAVVGVLVASVDPDGLERLAGGAGIAARARNLFTTPLAGYELRGFGAEWLGKAAAGLAGLVAIAATTLALGKLIARRRGA